MQDNKEKQLIQAIKDSFSEINVPDVKKSIKARYLEERKLIAHKRSLRPLPNMRFFVPRLIGSIAVFVMILFSVHMAFFQTPTLTANDDIRFQTITSVSLFVEEDLDPLSDASTDDAITAMSYSILLLSDDEIQDEIDEINKYLPFVEQVLSSTSLASTFLPSDRPHFRYLEKITIASSLNPSMEYLFYYNIESTSKDDFTLVGIVFFHETSYHILAKRELLEQAFKTTVTTSVGENTIVSTRNENNRNELTYHLNIQNKNSAMKLRLGAQQNRVSLDFIEGVLQGDYAFEFNENEDNHINVLAKNGLINFIIRAKLFEEDESYEYEDVNSGQTYRKSNPVRPSVPNRPIDNPNHPGNR